MALLDSEIWNAKGAAGDFFRSVNKQMFINQGIHIATADGKALASCMPGRSQDGKQVTTDESKREVWIKETQAAIERGLKSFGEVKPRPPTTGDPLPSDAVGVHADGSVSLASYTRTMHAGLNPDGFGPPAIDDATLTAKEWAALAPAKAVPGTEWTVPDNVARKLNPVLSTSCNDSLPSPKEVTSVRFTGKVNVVENGVAYVTYEGSIAGAHKSVHGYVWTSEANVIAGVGAYDLKAGKMLSFTLVFEGSRRNSKYYGPADRPERFGAVLEWRLSAEKPAPYGK